MCQVLGECFQTDWKAQDLCQSDTRERMSIISSWNLSMNGSHKTSLKWNEISLRPIAWCRVKVTHVLLSCPSIPTPPSLPSSLPSFHFLVGQFRDLQNTLLVLLILSDAISALVCFLSFSSLLTNEKKGVCAWKPNKKCQASTRNLALTCNLEGPTFLLCPGLGSFPGH